jgi:hypothetical protein
MRGSLGELVHQGYDRSIWQNKYVRVAIQALMIIVFSATTALAKRLHPSMGIPSSSAPFWLSVMVLSRCTMNWKGAGTLVGIGTAVWGIPFQLEQSFGQNLASFVIAGFVLDIMLLIPKMNIRRWWGALSCALAANMAQFGVIMYSSLTATVVKHFQIVGILNSVGLHIAFGIVAGLLGWAAFRAGQMGFRRLSR